MTTEPNLEDCETDDNDIHLKEFALLKLLHVSFLRCINRHQARYPKRPT